MSCCTIYEFHDGKPISAKEFGNSWGGAMVIWTAMFDRYEKNPAIAYDNVLTAMHGPRGKRFWGLWQRQDIPEFMRAVFAATFDRAIVRREHFARYANDLREFVKHFGKGDGACHLPAWADYVEACEAEAVGFQQTSVAENLWFDYPDDGSDAVPYDLNTGDQHMDVYAELEALTSQAASSAQ
jgi:hypothetical protein